MFMDPRETISINSIQAPVAHLIFIHRLCSKCVPNPKIPSSENWQNSVNL